MPAIAQTEPRGYVPLHVVPELLPEQQRLPAAERDMVVARRRGAEWVPGCGHMRASALAGAADVEFLIARFGGDEARERAESALAASGPRVSRLTMARAANDEVVRAGLTPARTLPEGEVARERRRHFFTVPEAGSEFSTVRFDALAREAGLAVHVDLDRGAPTHGLRYVDAGARVPAELQPFLGAAAREAFAGARRRGAEGRDLVADVASALAGRHAVLVRPLVLPRESAEPEAQQQIETAFAAMPRPRRTQVEEATRRALESGRAPAERLRRALAAAMPEREARAESRPADLRRAEEPQAPARRGGGAIEK